MDHVETAGDGDATRAAREGVDDNVDAVAVYGGDGTVMQAVAGIVGRDVPIGLIPGGTGNLLAGNLRLPRSPTEAARTLARGRPRAIDLGTIERASGIRYFVVACGVGFDATLMGATSGETKRRWGFAAYFARAWALRSEIPAVPYSVTVDGRTTELDATSILVANCSEFIPPTVRMAPGIALDDGILDAVILRADGVLEAFHTMWDLVRGVIDGSRIRCIRGQEIRIESESRRPVELDGEVDGVTPVTVSVRHQALSVLVAPE